MTKPEERDETHLLIPQPDDSMIGEGFISRDLFRIAIQVARYEALADNAAMLRQENKFLRARLDQEIASVQPLRASLDQEIASVQPSVRVPFLWLTLLCGAAGIAGLLGFGVVTEFVSRAWQIHWSTYLFGFLSALGLVGTLLLIVYESSTEDS